MDYQKAREFEGEMVQFRTKKGDWRIGRVVKVTKDQVQIEELMADADHTARSSEGYAFPWGRGPGCFHHHHRHRFRPWGPWRDGEVAAFDIAAIELLAFPFLFW